MQGIQGITNMSAGDKVAQGILNKNENLMQFKNTNLMISAVADLPFRVLLYRTLSVCWTLLLSTAAA